jgi:3-hydroxyacyl-CoA dehydrogenase
MSAPFRGPDRIGTVAVIGAGLIGGGWAAAYLARGLTVRVADPAPDTEPKLRAHIAAVWPQLQMLGLSDMARQYAITFHATPEEAATGADFIQENTPESESLKAELCRRLDAVAPPDVIIASSTSSFPITSLQTHCKHPGRCVLGHPFNPVHLMPLVELGGGAATDEAAIDTALDFYRHIGKQPVRLHNEIFGHVANRLASAMFREAVYLVSEGITTAAGIDDALRFGPALKWAIQGQFMTYYTSGGNGGMASFLEKFGPGQESRWRTLGNPTLTPNVKDKIVQQTEAIVAGRSAAEIARDQDNKLFQLLQLLHRHAPRAK